MPTRPDEPLHSLDNGLAVLELLAREPELGVSDLARRTGLGKSTIHRVLVTLAGRDFVVRNPETGKYSLGVRLLELGTVALGRMAIGEKAVRYLRELVAEHNETANVGVLDGTSVLYLHRVETTEVLRADLRVGTRVPLHCSALGKAILSQLPEERLLPLVERIPLTRYTATTISDRAALLAHLAETRERGYAVDDEEYAPGIRCVAAPVWDHTGGVAGAISLAGPSIRMTLDRVHELAGPVRNAAARISRELGNRLWQAGGA